MSSADELDRGPSPVGADGDALPRDGGDVDDELNQAACSTGSQ
jgi:hypothetical protein